MKITALVSFSILLLFFVTESVISLMEHRKNYFTKDMLSNIFIGAGLMLLSNFSKLTMMAGYMFAYQFRVFTTGGNIGVWALCFLANDLTFYLYHLASHKLKLFWITHSVHHSSEYYNLTTAFRQSWLGTINGYGLFWLWMPLAGFDPMMIMVVYHISLLYQSWLHTELIGKLPAPFEFIFNTPSHHRVHHASNPQYIDKNMGGVFIFWDRLFGTYAEEVEKPVYGLTRPIMSVNPVVILTKGFADFFGEVAASKPVCAVRGFIQKKISELAHPGHWKNVPMLKSVLFTILLLSYAQYTTAQTAASPGAGDHQKRLPGRALWGELNIGNGNYGFHGQLGFNYRVKNKFITTGVYKSHLCYQGDYQGLGFPDTRMCVNHTTIVSYSAGAGIIFPGRLCPSISCGISFTQFTYKLTEPEKNILSLATAWETVTGGDGMDDILNTKVVTAIGIPFEFRLHIAQRHFTGFDAGIKIDVNKERVITAAQLGIRFGKIVRKRGN